MKKILSKIALTVTLLLSLFLTFNTIPVFASTTNMDGNQISKIQNEEALFLFKTLNKNNKNTRSLKNIEKSPILKNEFEELNLLKIKSKHDIEIIYNKEDENIATIIAYNQNSNSNMLLEANNKTGDIILAINDEEYRLTQEGEDIIIYSNNGNKIPVLITEHQTKTSENLLSKEILKETRTAFGKNYGPYYKTNKVLVEVLGTIGTATGVATVACQHPILGIISAVSSAVSWVGDHAYATLYIKYYQAYATNDPTYVRQTEYFYNYNNYTSLVKKRIWYFYSSKPY